MASTHTLWPTAKVNVLHARVDELMRSKTAEDAERAYLSLEGFCHDFIRDELAEMRSSERLFSLQEISELLASAERWTWLEFKKRLVRKPFPDTAPEASGVRPFPAEPNPRTSEPLKPFDSKYAKKKPPPPPRRAKD